MAEEAIMRRYFDKLAYIDRIIWININTYICAGTKFILEDSFMVGSKKN